MIILIVIGILLAILFLYILASNMLLARVATSNKPPYKLLAVLMKCKLINIYWLLIADERREKIGLPSLFNNGDGFYYECENHCESKNDIQRNYIAVALSTKHFVDKDPKS